MTVNQSARSVRLLIGSVDFTPCLISWEGSDSHLDQSGLITFTGQIVLGKAIDFPYSLDDRKNPGLFCRGKSVTLEIAAADGNLTLHPRGALRILTPRYDSERQQLTIEIGDLITLLNFKEPTDPDKADNKQESEQSANVIIEKLLLQADITNIDGTSLNTNYNYPLNLSGSYLQSVGKILYANNCFGWIDNQEQFVISSVDIKPRQSLVHLTVGINEIWYRRLSGAESPCEKLKAVGTQIVTREIELGNTTISEQYGSPSVIDPELSGLIVINRTTETQSWNEDERIFTIKSEIEKPWGLVVPQAFWDNVVVAPILQLISGEIRIEESEFEPIESGGKLIKKTTTSYTEKSQYLAEIEEARPGFIVNNFIGIVKTKIVVESFIYSEKEVLLKKISETQELAVIVLNGSDENWDDWLVIPEFFIPSEYKYEEWKEIDKYTWEYNSYTLKPFVKTEGGTNTLYSEIADDRFKQKTGLVFDSSEKRRSNSGQETPPAAERIPIPARTEENPIEYSAYFEDPCSGNFKQRERTFNVELLAGIKVSGTQFFIGDKTEAHQQLKAIALREGRLLRGRWQGQEMAGVITNTLLNSYEPLFGIHVSEADASENYLADGVSWVVSAQKALWSCDGIWVGTSISAIPVDVDTVIPGAVTLPYAEITPSDAGMGMGMRMIFYPYSLASPTQSMELGLGLGINDWAVESFFSFIYWEEIDWGNLPPVTWNGIKPSPLWNVIDDWDNIDWSKIL